MLTADDHLDMESRKGCSCIELISGSNTSVDSESRTNTGLLRSYSYATLFRSLTLKLQVRIQGASYIAASILDLFIRSLTCRPD